MKVERAQKSVGAVEWQCSQDNIRVAESLVMVECKGLG